MPARVRWRGTTTQRGYHQLTMAARSPRRRPRQRMQASSSARGYGYAHRKLQGVLLAAWQPGDACARCGRPMWQRWTVTPSGRRVSAIHLGHNDDRTAWTGLEHASCNLSDGATRGNAMRVRASSHRTAKAIPRQSRNW